MQVTVNSGTSRQEIRELGRHRGKAMGPTLVCIGGIHGNEPSGVEGLKRVLRTLEAEQPELRGEIVCLAGNLAALAQNERYLDRDLNRQWLKERVEHLRSRGPGEGASAEDIEQWELLTTIDSTLTRRRGPAVFLDLHSTSGPGAPFGIIEDTLPNRRLAFALPIPVVMGLEEQVEGTFIDWINSIGYRGISVEGGQHADPATITHHEATVWIMLAATGLLKNRQHPLLAKHRDVLHQVARKFPRVLEARYRHGVEAGDGFVMNPGYSSFSKVRKDDELGSDNDGRILARESGHLLLPLYQRQGNDGFFMVRRVAPFWLWLAATLRRLRVSRWIHYLPGVERHPERRYSLILERRVVRYYPRELFTLMGYRRQRQVGSKLVLQRRPQRLRFS